MGWNEISYYSMDKTLICNQTLSTSCSIWSLVHLYLYHMIQLSHGISNTHTNYLSLPPLLQLSVPWPHPFSNAKVDHMMKHAQVDRQIDEQTDKHILHHQQHHSRDVCYEFYKPYKLTNLHIPGNNFLESH